MSLGRTNVYACIGILDIAGFEKLRHNSFEQMCINLVNEKLQNFMNVKIFKLEMDIYQQEGIQLEGIEFRNNEPLLDMFEKVRNCLKIAILAKIFSIKVFVFVLLEICIIV